MKFLTAEQILFIHARLIDETGGSHGMRDLSMLLSAAGRPKATYGGRDLYPDIFDKASALMDSLIRNHPFLDGNKRTGVAAAVLFLRINGYQFNCPESELVSFAIGVAESKHGSNEIAAWLKVHAAQPE